MKNVFPIVLWALSFQDPALDRVAVSIEKLRSDRVEVRNEGVRELKAMGPITGPQLETVSQDTDPEVANRAKRLLRIFALMKRLPPRLMETFPGIEDQLTDASPETWIRMFLKAGGKQNGIRQYPKLTRPELEVLAIPAVQGAGTDKEKAAVCTSIGELNLRGAIPELRTIVRNSPKVPAGGYEACKEAVIALGKLGARDASPELLAFLKSPAGFTVDGEAIKALGVLGTREAAPDIAKYLTASGQYEREWAARALGQLRSREMIPRILPLLGDSEWNVRAQAANTLSELGAYESLPRLLELLKDPECQGRVAGAIGKIATQKELAPLHSLLKSDVGFVRSSALDSLAALGAKEYVPEFIILLKDDDDDVRSSAVYALGSLGAREAIPSVFHALRDSSGSVRSAAARALGDWGEKTGLPELVKLLKDEDTSVRASAVYALGRMGRMEDGSFFLQDSGLHHDPSGEVRSEVAGAISNLAGKEELPALLLLLKDYDEDVRVSALAALGALGGADAVKLASALLDDFNAKVRAQAIKTLAFLNADLDPGTIRKQFTDADEQVRVAAAQWLCEHGHADGAPILIRESSDLVSLNALRSPKSWPQLKARSIPKTREGTLRSILEQMAKEAHFKVDFSELSAGEIASYFSRRKWSPPGKVEKEFKADFWDTLPDFYQFIVDDDQLRIVNDEGALKFWKDWLGKRK